MADRLAVALIAAIAFLPVYPQKQPAPTHCKLGPCPEKKHYGDDDNGSKPNWWHGMRVLG